ncbi:MAG: hypothetical protein CMH12_22815 [Maritimibacter sp.]|nr:hypothetical protein [Maritimibacter sp.]
MDISLSTLSPSAPPKGAVGGRSGDSADADGFGKLLGAEPAAEKPTAKSAKAADGTEQPSDEPQVDTDENGTQASAEDGSVEDGEATEVRSEDGLEASSPVGADEDLSGEFRSRPGQAQEDTASAEKDMARDPAPEVLPQPTDTPAPMQTAAAPAPVNSETPTLAVGQAAPETGDAELPVAEPDLPDAAPLRATADKPAAPATTTRAPDTTQVLQITTTAAEPAQSKASAARAETTFADLVTNAGRDGGETAETPAPRTSAPTAQLQTTSQAADQTQPMSAAQLRAAVAQALPQPAAEQSQPAPQPKSPIVQKVVDQVAQLPTEPGTTTIRLKPHGMGIVEISVERTKDGRLDVDMRVQNPLVLDAMRNERGALSHLFQGTGAQGSLSMDLFQPGAGQNGQDAPGDTADGPTEHLAEDTGDDLGEPDTPAAPKQVSGGLDILT